MKRVAAVALVIVLIMVLCASVALAAKCVKCGAELAEGAKFCPECGEPVPQISKCPQCGVEVPAGAKFCPECGAKIGEARTAPARRERPTQRYEGIFPVALLTPNCVPLKTRNYAPWQKADEEELAAWQQNFLSVVKELGFNTVTLSTEETEEAQQMVARAEEIGLYVIVGKGFHKLLDQGGLTEKAALEALVTLSELCDRHQNIIAGFLYRDPVKDQWLDNWRVLGGVWNELHPEVPLLATYRDSVQWQQFDGAAPIGAAQAWSYVFREGRSTAQALNSPVCTHLDCKDGRQNMPGIPIWPWMPGVGNGWGMRWPSIEEMNALYYVALAEGARGSILYRYGVPSPDGPEFMADENLEPIQLLLDMKPMLHRVVQMGTKLLDYEIDDELLKNVEGKAAASVYVAKDGSGQKCLMVASKDVELTQTVKVTFDAGGDAVADLIDFLEGSSVDFTIENGLVVCQVEVEPASGRLLWVLMAD